eukprot:490370-Rhodomonas_salina.1
MGIDPRDLLPRPPPEERFSKDGINNVEINQYRLLVHCPGCPPFLCLIDPSTTIGNLQKEVRCSRHQPLSQRRSKVT